MHVTAQQIILLVIGVVGAPMAAMLIVGAGDGLLRPLSFRRQRAVRPWLWLVTPLLLVGLILVYPTLSTIYLSFRNNGAGWAGVQNFAWAFGSTMRPVLRNNLVWIVAFPLVTVALGLVVAVLFDRIRYERLVRTIIVLPTAISFTAGSLIWRMMYEYQPSTQAQTGTVNAVWTLIPGAKPVAWLIDPKTNNFALIFVAVWMSLGVAALILSAAVKNIPQEIVDAARVDGAGELGVFYYITLPSLWPTILVVWTTEVIFALKVFDIVYVMTNGSYGTDTIANKMYEELFSLQNFGHAAAIAVILVVVALPVVFVNIRQVRAGMES